MKVMKNCKFYNDNQKSCNALKQLYCALEDKPCKFYQKRKSVRKPVDNSK